MLAAVHASICCYGAKGVEGHREFDKQFIGKEIWQTKQINPAEIMHPSKCMVPSWASTLSLIMWLLLSPSGLVREVCAGHIPVSTHICHTLIRHFTPAWFGEIPSTFHTSSSLASPFPPKAPFSRTPWGENIEKRFDIEQLTSAQAEKDAWEWPANSLGTYFDQGGLTKQKGAGKARSC